MEWELTGAMMVGCCEGAPVAPELINRMESSLGDCVILCQVPWDIPVTTGQVSK